MIEGDFPKDAIFVKCGNFYAGIVGKLAIAATIIVFFVLASGRLAGLW